jgi:hypothetical protein
VIDPYEGDDAPAPVDTPAPSPADMPDRDLENSE